MSSLWSGRTTCQLRNQLAVGPSGSVFTIRARVSRKMYGLSRLLNRHSSSSRVAVHMLDAHFVEGADERALEEAPHAFDAVCVDIPYDPLLGGVVDGLVARVVVSDTDVGPEVVGVDRFSLIPHGAAQ